MPTLALKPRGDLTRSPKQGCQLSHKKGLMSYKIFFKKDVLVTGILNRRTGVLCSILMVPSHGPCSTNWDFNVESVPAAYTYLYCQENAITFKVFLSGYVSKIN